MGAMRGLRAVQQVGERQLEQGANLLARPIVADGGQRWAPVGGINRPSKRALAGLACGWSA
jgi:hypothetical protein